MTLKAMIRWRKLDIQALNRKIEVGTATPLDIQNRDLQLLHLQDDEHNLEENGEGDE